MSGELFEFPWLVSKSGYRWVTGKIPDKEGELHIGADAKLLRLLVESERVQAASSTVYDPLVDHAALFRTFADTQPTEDGILTFANRYGRLGTTLYFGMAPGELLGLAEPFDLWVKAIAEMRQAVELWDWIRPPVNREALMRHLRWDRGTEGDTLLVYDSHPGLTADASPVGADFRTRMVIASSDRNSYLFSLIPEGNLVLAARAGLHQIVNKHLSGQAHPRLLFGHQQRGRLDSHLRIRPDNLLACLWLQFAEAVAGGKSPRQCSACQQWFESGRSRTDKQYCSVACRNRAYRDRQDQARELYAAGKRAKQIAQELGTDEQSVKKWIKGVKRKG